jgi:rhamnulokinase
MGAEIPKPCINEKSLSADFTNEGGVCDTFRFLKNLTGLWIVQECRRAWEKQGQALKYSQLTQMASEAQALVSFIDTADAEFGKPGDMPEKIRTYCRKTNQPVPDSIGAVVRCALESLALTYRKTLGQLESILEKRLDPIHMVGGGAQNKLLCQFAADATRRRVVAGPVEATAIGSVLMQAMALKQIASLEEGREIVRRSFEVETYEPKNSSAWDDAFERFNNLQQ